MFENKKMRQSTRLYSSSSDDKSIGFCTKKEIFCSFGEMKTMLSSSMCNDHIRKAMNQRKRTHAE